MVKKYSSLVTTQDDPETTDVFIHPGSYYENLFSEDGDGNLFSGDNETAEASTMGRR